jgi:hypothetical protein
MLIVRGGRVLPIRVVRHRERGGTSREECDGQKVGPSRSFKCSRHITQVSEHDPSLAHFQQSFSENV